MSEEPKKTLSDDEVTKIADKIMIYGGPKPKPTFKAAAWGFVVWLVLVIALLVFGGWAISVLWNNIAADLSFDTISFTTGVNITAMIMLVSRIWTALRIMNGRY